MHDLEAAGRAVIDSPALPPTPIEHIEARAHGLRRRGRVRATAALVTAVALIGGAVLVANVRNTAKPVAANHPTPRPVTRTHVDSKLRAHLGLDAPKGWIPADYGDARLWVPPSWKEGPSGECPHPSTQWIELGRSGDEGFCRSGKPPSIFIAHLIGPVRGTRHLMVNGYSIVESLGPGSTLVWSVPELHVAIAATSIEFERELKTIGPSARAIALGAAPQPTPQDWQRVAAGGISLAVPSGWSTRLVTNDACVDFAEAEVLVGTPNEAAQCQATLADLAPSGRPADGAWLEPGVFTQPNGTPVPGPWDSGMSVAADAGQWSILVVYVTVGKQSRSIEIGLGPDGRIANAILHSIKVATTTAFAVPGCAPTPDRVTLREASPRTQLVTGHPERAVLCVYGSGAQATEHLLGTTSPDPAETARQLNSARPPDGVACPAIAYPWIGILHFEYPSGERSTIQVGSCLTGNEHGVVLTPPGLGLAVRNIAEG